MSTITLESARSQYDHQADLYNDLHDSITDRWTVRDWANLDQVGVDCDGTAMVLIESLAGDRQIPLEFIETCSPGDEFWVTYATDRGRVAILIRDGWDRRFSADELTANFSKAVSV